MENDAATPDQILDAAEALFAKQGFAATTIKQIGAGAGLNPALIYYYFGDKEKLYRELLRRTFGRFVGEAASRVGAAVPPQEAIRALIGWQSEALAADPALPRLIVRELLDAQGERAREEIARLVAGAFTRLCAVIEEGQRAGLFRADLSARFCAISAISLLPYAHIATPVIGMLMGNGDERPTREQMEAYGRHAAEFVLSALAARPDPNDG